MILVQKSHDHMTVTRSKEIPRMTAKAITSLLLDSSHLFKSYLKEWTASVTNKNLYFNIPVSYFADLMRQYRQIYSRYIEKFIISQGRSINPETTCHWFTLVNEGFDRLLSQFINQMDSYKKQKSRQRHFINDISAVALPLVGQIGVLPLSGQVDSAYLEWVLKGVPDQCINLEVSHLFIDMSGVLSVDGLIAEELSKLTRILSLLGISVTISGMKPEIALFTIRSGIDFSRFSTAGNLKQATKQLWSQNSGDIKLMHTYFRSPHRGPFFIEWLF